MLLFLFRHVSFFVSFSISKKEKKNGFEPRSSITGGEAKEIQAALAKTDFFHISRCCPATFLWAPLWCSSTARGTERSSVRPGLFLFIGKDHLRYFRQTNTVSRFGQRVLVIYFSTNFSAMECANKMQTWISLEITFMLYILAFSL